MYIAADATSHLINSWNLHRVPGSMGCVPVQNMQATRRNVLLTDNLVPPTPRAVRLFEAQGGQLTRDSSFGYDPIEQDERKYMTRMQLFQAQGFFAKDLFSDIVHGQYNTLHNALECYYRLTITL